MGTNKLLSPASIYNEYQDNSPDIDVQKNKPTGLTAEFLIYSTQGREMESWKKKKQNKNKC